MVRDLSWQRSSSRARITQEARVQTLGESLGKGKGNVKGVSKRKIAGRASLQPILQRRVRAARLVEKENREPVAFTSPKRGAPREGPVGSCMTSPRPRVSPDVTIVDHPSIGRETALGLRARARERAMGRARVTVRRPLTPLLADRQDLQLLLTRLLGPIHKSGASNQGGITVPGEVPSASNSQGSGSVAPNVAQAQTQVLEEAQKLLKSLRIASMRVSEDPEGGHEGAVETSASHEVPAPREESFERVHESPGHESWSDNPEEDRPRGITAGSELQSEVFVPSVAIRRTRHPTGLLDGGATHPLRRATEYEWQQATPTRVALAVGSQDLRMSQLGTVLTQESVSPICPLGLITDCLSLISELDQLRLGRLQQALGLRAMALGVNLESQGETGTSAPERLSGDIMMWLKTRFPDLPDWLVMRSLPVPGFAPTESPYHVPGLNRRGRKALRKARHVVVHLFSGRTKPLELRLGQDTVFLNIDALRQRDMLDERVYAAVVMLCTTGKVDAVIGGLPCGTNSPLREKGGSHDARDGGPRPIRGRTGLLRFGLPSNSDVEQRLVEDHSALVTRFMVVHWVADTHNPRGSLSALENPEDPHRYLAIEPILNNPPFGPGRSSNPC